MVVPLPPDRSPPERCHSFPPRCRNASRYQVLLGATQLSNPGPQACYIRVAQVVTNPLYAGEASSGDVALLHLAKAVTFTRYVSPICLPGTGVRFPPGLNCWVTGWGNLRCCEEVPAPQALQKLAVPIIDTGNCSAMYATDAGNRLQPRHIRDDMLCAGYAEGKKDACKGDSGGPLVCPLGSQWALAGIVSWGEGCGVRNRPGVYTRLTAYRDWIRRHIPKLHFMGEPGPARGWGRRSS
ncbi:serine protease 27 [Alligator mississippiensis]|uniref:Serine protease 27 n=1 Tax=Alligator mississippiensis TaxID=8496 RepID=A0A151PE59_ALLMI|nr:serine protease 27 [Alligator mississippiensis]